MGRNLKTDLIQDISKNIKKALGTCLTTTIVSGTDAVTGNWYCVIPLEATGLDVSGCSVDITNFPTGDVTIGAGVALFGNWTSIELNSGSVLAFETC